MNKNAIEILAPAGDEDMLRAAVFSGADCVYVGVRGMNARRTANNFDAEGLVRAVGFCHARNCRVYAALNTLVFPGQQAQLAAAVCAVRDAGCDAVIVQDLAAAAAVQALAPGLALHASTQMSVHSPAGVRALANLGFSRAILARELSEREIAAIAKDSPIELEVFVHGALCVSVSGQCSMSALLGGRSGNRGGCAGPCRLPFRAEVCRGEAWQTPPAEQKHRPEQREHALSLKDLSVLDALPRLAEMGVASAKIEGRLRGPEYCAVVVDAARRARAGEEYDRGLVRDVFSRSGFTNGWFTGRGGPAMFGARTEADTGAARRAQPAARALYRREMPRVPVHFSLRLRPEGGTLCVSDGRHTLERVLPSPLAAAETDAAGPLRAALGKTGGTPFYVPEDAPPDVETNGLHLPAGAAGEARRALLEELLRLRGAAPREEHAPPEAWSVGMPAPAAQREAAARLREARKKRGRPALRARFLHVAGMPPAAAGLCDELLVPLREADEVPAALRAKTRLWLPRVLFGGEEARAAEAVREAAGMGFLGFEVQNLAHLVLCEGLPVAAGFGMNVTNAFAAARLAGAGCSAATLSPELSLRQMQAVAMAEDLRGAVALDALCYGHLPLMLTRACPLQGPQGCRRCPAQGRLVDRKGRAFPILCQGERRVVLNPTPLWMGDCLHELPTEYATLYFSVESPQQALEVLQAFAEGRPAPGGFTRGLYRRGTEE